MAQAKLEGSRRVLRTICIVVAVFAVLEMIFGLFFFFGAGLLADQNIVVAEMDGQAVDAAFAARVLGIVFFGGGLVDFLIALLGAHGAKHSDKLTAFKVICIVGVVLSVVSIVAYIAQGQASSILSQVISAVLEAVCAFLAFRISGNAGSGTYAG